MNIQHLRYFIAVSSSGRFTAAAKELHVSQPTVSSGIAELEKQMEVKLFNRDSRHVSLTAEGRILLEYAVQIVDLLKEAKTELAAGEVLPGEKVRFGAVDGAVIYLLPDLLRDFSHRFPGVELTTSVSSSRPLMEEVLLNRSDFAVVTLPISHPQIEVISLVRDPLPLVVNPEHRFACRKSVAASDIAVEPLITFHPESVSRQIVDEEFAKKGVSLTASMEMSSPDAIRKLVESGAGIAFLSEMTVEDSLVSESLTEVQVRGLKLSREIGLIWRRGRHFSPGVRRLIEAILARFDHFAEAERFAGRVTDRSKG